MKRLSLGCSLFHPATLIIVASLSTQHPAFGQKGSNAPSLPGGVSGPVSRAPVTGEEKEAAAFRDRCLLLTTKFKHNGVEFQSKTGIGCVIATPQGQRILAMPLSMTEPIEISQGNEKDANPKLTIPSSLLLAAKIGSDKKSRERLEAFNAQVADMPTVNGPKDFALESERKIFLALNERDEVAFNGTPLSGVMKFFRNSHSIPIVIDYTALEMEQLTPDEPITLKLPQVAFRSALNLILEPLKLTYVIENEVLKITTKQAAASVEVDTPKAVRASQMGTLAYSFSARWGSGSMDGAESRDCYGFASVQRYRTFQEAQRANLSSSAPTGMMGGMGGGGMGGMGGDPNERREYAAIHGPLAVQVHTDLGVAFVSLPGDFQSIPIPTRVDLTRDLAVMVEDEWETITDMNASRRSVLEGSPVIDEHGKPVGMYLGDKVVSFPQLFEALMSLDAKYLGYWGAELTKIESQIVEGLPELIPAELKSQIEKAASLQGKEKTKAMQELRSLLSTQVEDRNRFAERKLNALRSKLDALTRLSYEMKKKDTAEVNKILPKELSLKIYENQDEAPFK